MDSVPESAELLRLTARGERDVFVVRQRGREVAAALGLDQASQVRLATALSEVGRYLLPTARPTTVAFRLVDASIVVTLTVPGAVPAQPGSPLTEGMRAAARLMDAVEVHQRPSSVDVVLRRHLPSHFAVPPAPELARIRAELQAVRASSVLDELGVQNTQLISALEEVQTQRDELLRLNGELEETNRGVLALYTQLSDEMEQTNRGVVALYAELDERTAQLREASEAKSRFLRNVSHELRAPITAVLGMLRLLLDPRSEPLSSEQSHQLTLASTSAQDLLDMVNQLLDLAKAEANRLEPRWGSVDLRAVFDQLRGTLRHLARPDVDLLVEDPDVPVLVTDEVMLVQVLRNLLSNGLKFTARGSVALSARYDEAAHRAVLTVTDTGVGIDPAQHERIFEEFYQVPGTKAGTGLGLPYARRLCEVLGAELTLSSEPGRGSTFTVSLPRSPGDASPIHTTVDLKPIPAAARRMERVLVADDDTMFREHVQRLLTERGITVTAVADGRAALAAARAERPDAIVLDLRMPHLGGLEVLGALAEDPRLDAVAVVLVTEAELDEIGMERAARAQAVLDKATLTDDGLVGALYEAAVRRGRDIPTQRSGSDER
ncbi:sensor histidine kinase [Virgisporangium aliadipatigenens]|uniref:histidine kinase n=1 Tax=Virgisporangium aliadipatigenens TaxID=741659 RepID=A0A8J4DM33_9ACTN|nr:ATP-binding protein [Virgisporangium aliadipatigenens]GIJ43360.1 sensor histidine kinase [Virgisporangium aliadipatigenens]